MGDLVTLTLSETSNWGGINGANDARATVFTPAGDALITFDSNSQQDLTLPESGTYIIRVNANNLVSTGSYNLGVECLLPTDPVQAALSCGDLVSDAIDAQAEVDQFTFTGQVGDLVTLTLSETSNWGGINGANDARATVFTPAGDVLITFDSNSQQDLTLPESGTYIIRVNANNLASTGSYNFSLTCL